MAKQTQIWLPDAGLYYYKARIYSPTLGRFLQTDPIGYGDGLNWYNYVSSDPINFTDPTGLCRLVTIDFYWYRFDDGKIGERLNHAGTEQTLQNCEGGIDIGFSGGLAANAGGGSAGYWGVPGGTSSSSRNRKESNTNNKRNKCAVPAGGPGKSQLDANIETAEQARQEFASSPWSIFDAPAAQGAKGAWFAGRVKTNGVWDYKNKTAFPNGQNFGNFNYGATAAALGYDWPTTLAAAHSYSIIDNLSLESQKTQIARGFIYARDRCDEK